jgi:hypothetical protein
MGVRGCTSCYLSCLEACTRRYPISRVPTVAPQTHLGRGNEPTGEATISPPHVAILNFYLVSYLSTSLAAQGPKKISLKNIMLIMAPERCCQRSENAYHSVVGCRVAGRSARGAPLGGDDGDLRAPTPYLEDIDGGAPERRCRRPGSAHHLS